MPEQNTPHMDDRTLIERAAKAAGIKALRDPNGTWRDCTGFDPMMNIFAGAPWNPLADDGDALRLAVKLRLVIQHAPKYVVVLDHAREIAEHEDTRENKGDEMAATRRAIVRAAASLAMGE